MIRLQTEFFRNLSSTISYTVYKSEIARDTLQNYRQKYKIKIKQSTFYVYGINSIDFANTWDKSDMNNIRMLNQFTKDRCEYEMAKYRKYYLLLLDTTTYRFLARNRCRQKNNSDDNYFRKDKL